MAYLPGKPLYTSPEASVGFFHARSQLALEDPDVDPMRCTKQVCGGSNRNGSLFVGYHRTGGAGRLAAKQVELVTRPRSAMARAFRQEIEERDQPLKLLPAFRYRAEFERKPPLRPTARGRPMPRQQRRTRPQSAPVGRSPAYDGPPRTNRGRVVTLPEDFVPFKAFSSNWSGAKAPAAAAAARAHS